MCEATLITSDFEGVYLIDGKRWNFTGVWRNWKEETSYQMTSTDFTFTHTFF